MRRSRLLCGAGLVLWLLIACSAAARARDLYWDEMAVTARLDSTGLLHVTERQTMVFTGDWNGGERIFRLATGQELELVRISRLESSAAGGYPLMKGDLSQVDHYEWTRSNVLRWRSRATSDPPFDATPITYLIEYTLFGVLDQQGDRYRFDHDFAFPDRVGPIVHFSLDLEIDPVWRGASAVAGRHTVEDLAAGRGMLLTTEFTYLGEGRPSAALHSLPRSGVYALFVAALVAMAMGYVRFRRGEVAAGRYAEPEIPHPLGRDWLEKHLFDLSPELVGALWDEAIGPPEVAAVLARMELEGKLSSEVVAKTTRFGSDLLRLRLTAKMGELSSYEHKLVLKLFFDGGRETDTEAIRHHYRKKGFQPASVIAPFLNRRVEQIVRADTRRPSPSPRSTLLLFAAVGVLLVVVMVMKLHQTLALSLTAGMLLLLPTILGGVFSFNWRKRVRRLDLVSLTFLIPALVIWLLCLVMARVPFFSFEGVSWRPDWVSVAALALLPVAFTAWFLFMARTRQGRGVIRKRQLLAAAREEFHRQLESKDPDLDDAWLPYLLAFGLHKDMDRWFKSFAGSSSAAVGTSGSSFGRSAGAGGSGWSGGGGSFGGAGATSSWGAAAVGLATGVSAPSSSSSGGGGGGGSSGGGGGGGW